MALLRGIRIAREGKGVFVYDGPESGTESH